MQEKVTGNLRCHNSSAVSQRGLAGPFHGGWGGSFFMGWQWERLPGVSTNCRNLKGLQKGVLFVTVIQVRVNRAGEGAGVERACVRSKWRRREGVFWVFKENTKRRKRQSGRERMCIILESVQHTWERSLSAYAEKKGQKRERQNEGWGLASTSRLTH